MSRGWEQEAENWIRWARTPNHDSYWSYSPEFFERIVGPAQGSTLEIGCGEGRVARDLRDAGHDVVAIDVSPTLLAAATKEDPSSRYMLAAAESLPFPDSSFDAVVAYNSLMDVDDMPASVGEAARVLKPDGRFCICITHPISDAGRFEDNSPHAAFKIEGTYFGRRRFEERFERDGLEITFRSWLYPLSAYTKALENSGFVIERIEEPTPSLDSVAERPRSAKWRRVPLFMFIRAMKLPQHSG